MDSNNIAIGIEKYFKTYKELLNSAIKGKGSILAISGESGMGKTTLLNKLNEDCSLRPSISNVMVDNQSPIGSLELGKIQPLLPFTRAIEELLNKKDGKANKKFALNIGMTVLASIPIAGDVFYAVKELSRDYRQFKKEKSSENLQKASSAAADYFDSIMSIAGNAPLVLFLDDMQYCDAQSVELLSILTDQIEYNSLFIIISYQKSVLESKGTPLYSYIKQYSENKDVFNSIDLEPFNIMQIKELVPQYLPKIKLNTGLEQWLMDRSMGIPAVITEYLKYFQKYPLVNKEGDVDESKMDERFLPTTLNAAFSQVLETVTEDDRNAIAICSAEGREFTATIVSSLLNLDILSTIKRLRSIQQKTGIIKSVGARVRYGVKTTVYEFTQAFYHSYFQNTLEYEEHIALHGQIASLLQQKYESAATEDIKNQIAPYLAAHSSESGDELTAKNMLLKSAENAQELGNIDVVNSVYQSFKDLMNPIKDLETGEKQLDLSPQNIAFQKMMQVNWDKVHISDTDDVLEGDKEQAEITQKIDFMSIRRAIVEDFHSGKLSIALDRSITFLKTYNDELPVSGKIQLLALQIRIKTELNDYISANSDADEAFRLLSAIDDQISECFVLNSFALLKHKMKKTDEAYSILKKTAQKVLLLPAEMKLITMANVATILSEINPKKAVRYYKAISDLANSLKFDDIVKN